MAKIKIQPAGKALIAAVVIGGLVGWYFLFGGRQTVEKIKGDKPETVAQEGTPDTKTAGTPVQGSPAAVPGPGSTAPATPHSPNRVYKVALSQWPGHMAGIVACGGLTTQPGSFCSEVTSVIKPDSGKGLNLEFVFIEEPDKKNTALQTGKVDFVWQTTDELPINLPGYAKANVKAKSFVQIDWSRGGDACVADKAVTKPRDLLTRKAAVLKFSPDHTVLEFWLGNSDLSQVDLAKARSNIAFSMDDPTFARNLFCQGKVDVACLWEPDVSMALACRPGAYRVFSTKDADTLVADNLLATEPFLASHPEVAEKVARIFLAGAKIGEADKKAAAKLISTAVPRFRDELKYEATLASLDWVRWNDLGDNVVYFGVDGSPSKFDTVYKQADSIWAEYTEPDGTPALTQRFVPNSLRDGSIIKAIFESEKAQRAQEAAAKGTVAAPIEPEKPVYKPEVIAKAEPKMVKPVTINFDTGSTDLDVGARAILKAQVLTQVGLAEGMGLRVEGNTDDTGSSVVNKTLSLKRAESVKEFLVSQGMDANRVVAVGNGPDKPVCNAKTPDCRASNRRTDIVFVSAE